MTYLINMKRLHVGRVSDLERTTDFSKHAPRRPRWKEFTVAAIMGLSASCARYANYPVAESVNDRIERSCEEDRQCHMKKLGDAVLNAVAEYDLKAAAQALTTLNTALAGPDEKVRNSAAESLIGVVLSTMEDVTCVRKAIEEEEQCHRKDKPVKECISTCSPGSSASDDPREQRVDKESMSQRLLGEVRGEAKHLLESAITAGSLKTDPLALAAASRGSGVASNPIVVGLRIEYLVATVAKATDENDIPKYVAELDKILESGKFDSKQAAQIIGIWEKAPKSKVPDGMPHLSNVLFNATPDSHLVERVIGLVGKDTPGYKRIMEHEMTSDKPWLEVGRIVDILERNNEGNLDALLGLKMTPAIRTGIIDAIYKKALAGDDKAISSICKMANEGKHDMSKLAGNLAANGNASSKVLAQLSAQALTEIARTHTSLAGKVVDILDDAKALGRIGSSEKTEPAIKERIVGILEKMTPEGNASERSEVVTQLGSIISSTKDPKLQLKALNIMGEGLADKSKRVREAVVDGAVSVIHETPDPKFQAKALDIIGKGLADKSEDVREAAGDALTELYYEKKEDQDNALPRNLKQRALSYLNNSAWFRNKQEKARKEGKGGREAEEDFGGSGSQ